MTELNDDQRQKIEANRLKALEKLQAKLQNKSSDSYHCSTPSNSTQGAVSNSSNAPMVIASSSLPLAGGNSVNPFFQPRAVANTDSNNNSSFKFLKRPIPASFSKGLSRSLGRAAPHSSSGMTADSYKGTSVSNVYFEIYSRTKFSVNDIPILSSIMKSIPGFSYLIKEKKWIFPLEEYTNLVPLVKDKLSNATFHSIPQNVLSLFNGRQQLPPVEQGGQKRKRKSASNVDDVILSPDRASHSAHKEEYSPYFDKIEDIGFDLSLLDEKLKSSLLPFQVAGLRFALEQQGRILLADDMGLGKTIQSLAIASFYRLEWPFLIIVPASLLGSWTESIFEWMPSLERSQVNPLYASTINARLKANLPLFYDDAMIHIISYDFAVKHCEPLKAKKFQIVICDESHFLRNPTTKRCKVILPLLKKAGRVILLSGTPALSRPIELFTQIMAIRPKLFPNMVDYGMRYCAGFKSAFGWDFKGSSHTRELCTILENTIMLRRLKGAVLTQLPAKRRQQIFLQLDPATSKKMKGLMTQIDRGSGIEGDDAGAWQSNTLLMKCWRETGLSKLAAIQDYLQDIFSRDSIDDGNTSRTNLDMSEPKQKYIIFAHHQQVLDGLEDLLWKLKIPFIRIDGSTPVQLRHENCVMFQDPYSDIRVAVLSLTAAGVGLTLTAASTVIFAELFWNPGVLIQAEDRAHRIGQKDSVLIQYLLARGTTDDTLWPLILKKLNVLESVGLIKNEFYQIEKSGSEKEKSSKDSNQKSILEFVSPINAELPKK